MATIKKVMVFGVFDRLHPGHHYFLESAKKQGDELMVVVARDSSVRSLKNKEPQEAEGERLQKIGELPCIDRAVLGDEILGSYEVLRGSAPQLICLGYDQAGLEANLKEKMAKGEIPTIPMMRLEAHHPDRFRSSVWDGKSEI